MPVGKDEWNAGRKWETLQVRILAFLKTNRDKGFDANEIYTGLGYKRGRSFWDILAEIANLLTIHNALETLVKEGSVKAKIVKETVGEVTYYMVAQFLIFSKEYRNQLIGKCNTKGEIFLYPKKLDKCKKRWKLGKEGFKHYIETRAKAALIHELLHLKYEDNEAKVKDLTKKYYKIYSNHHPQKIEHRQHQN